MTKAILMNKVMTKNKRNIKQGVYELCYLGNLMRDDNKVTKK